MRLKNIIGILFILLFFTSCISNRVNISDASFDEIEMEYNQDLEEYEIKVGNFYDILILEYGPLPNNLLGRCRTDIIFGLKIRTLTLKEGVKDPFLIKYIYYHEMGHCNFNLKHDDNGFKLMNTIISEDRIDIYENNWDYLKYTYFTKIKNQQ